MIACLDVAYADDAAGAACALCVAWDADTAVQIVSRLIQLKPAAYERGAFYKRELPALQAILNAVSLPIEIIVIDGYVWIGSQNEAGLGAHLFAALHGRIPIVGVAKKAMKGDDWSVPVRRGTSLKPLFVTAAGIGADDAARAVARMHGDHRIPTMVKHADAAARRALRAERSKA